VEVVLFRGVVGGPDRDRTGDLFHAMEEFKPQNIDGTALTNRHNRQKRLNGRYLRAKCGQPTTQVAKGLIRVGSAQHFFHYLSTCAITCCTIAEATRS
jgi:hypothetical protein